jgi:hypothetical protein
MNLDCLNDIITDNLAIHIDLSDQNSWDLNNDLTSISLTKWSGAISDNIQLFDFGLTAYDNGRIDRMYSGLTITPNDTKVTLFRIGNNPCSTPYSGETMYDLYPISAITGQSVGNYFSLSGGYLQGFFKLDKYNFEQFPSRYHDGITIETIIHILPNSNGIFYLMGLRSEDKYNDYFSGETKLIETTEIKTIGSGLVGRSDTIVETVTGWSGVSTSENNNLNAYLEEQVLKESFPTLDDDLNKKFIWSQASQSANTRANVIAFELTSDKRIGYKLINEDNLIKYNVSPNQITQTGWTIITVTFTPDGPIPNYDPEKPLCFPRRKGTISFYVNGRLFWKEKDFDEFYFRGLVNEKEKQLVFHTIFLGVVVLLV